MVDASVGGKTGINFNGLKNEIGVFKKPYQVILDTIFLKTLDRENILSGYAEMLKHGLIYDEKNFISLLSFDIEKLDYWCLGNLVAQSVAIKEKIVEKDPFEKGIRKALNLGHIVGHALESWAYSRKPYLHGYTVAWGLVCELYLSYRNVGLPKAVIDKVAGFVFEKYGKLPISSFDYDDLYNYMIHDKKILQV